MFKKTEVKIMTNSDGIYQIKDVYQFEDDFFIMIKEGKYAKISASNQISHKNMRWFNIKGDRILNREENKLTMVIE